MDDLISRQAAIEALGEEPMVWTEDDDYALGERNQWRIDKLAIEAVPSAQQEQKRGKWGQHIFDGIMGGRPRAWMCDYCNTLAINRTNYCPYCGADMREGGE